MTFDLAATAMGAMPIRPENRNRYPKDWAEISLRKRILAEWRCEGSPAYPKCRAQNGQPHYATGSNVVLTVAHLDHQPENCKSENLRVMCQRCHNTYDAKHRKETRAATEREKLQGMADQGWLFEDF